MAGSSNLMEGLHDLHEAREDYDAAWSFWRGKSAEAFSSPAVRRALAKSSGMYGVNIAKVPITVLLDRLKVASIVALAADGVKDEEADGALRDCYAENKVHLLRTRLYRNTLVYGDSYVFAWRGDGDETARLHYNSPVTTRVLYDDEDESVASLGIKAWTSRGVRRANLLYPDHLELGWVCKEGAEPKDPASWFREADSEDIPNAWGRVPLVHFRTDMPYGVPDAEDAWGAQAAINKLSTTMVHTSEAAGFPARYGLQEPGAELNGEGMDNPDWEDDAEAGDGDEESRVKAGPGEMALLRGLKSVGEFSAASPDGFIKPADWYRELAAVVTGTPAWYLNGRGDAPSGASLRVADAPLRGRTETRQMMFDDAEKDLAGFTLALLGYEDRRADVRWKPAGIVDDATTWEIVQAKVSSGVPARVALAETGLYDQDEIDGWLADPSVEMDVQRRVWILSDVAASLSGLAQGVAQGLLSEQAAAAVVAATIGQLTPELEAAPQ